MRYQGKLLKLVGNNTINIPIGDKGHHYIHWSCKNSGAELWGAVEKSDNGGSNEFGCFDPHYRGKSRIRICLTSRYPRSLFACDVGFKGQVIPNDGSSRFDLGFDCPNYGVHRKHVVLPSTATCQIAAFAHDVAIFDSEEDFKDLASDLSTEPSKEEFVATCRFDRVADQNRPSYAVITGHIVEAELKVNELTRSKFYWALVRTVGGVEIDVVIDPKLVDDGPEPKVGGLITGYFFLSGHLIAADTNEKKQYGSLTMR